jgi:hypothetical protein
LSPSTAADQKLCAVVRKKPVVKLDRGIASLASENGAVRFQAVLLDVAVPPVGLAGLKTVT